MKILNNTPIEVTYCNKKDNILFETIKSQNGIIYNLTYHQNRLNRAFKELFKKEPTISLKDILKPQNNLTRVKVVYNKDGIVDIFYYPYKPKEINKLLLIEAKDFDYSYKYLNRDFFENLFRDFSGVDEFIITQNGYITDCTIANLAFFDNNRWVSPKKVLLNGTTRQRLLDKKEIFLKDIYYTNIKKYSKIAILNAMVGFYILKD